MFTVPAATFSTIVACRAVRRLSEWAHQDVYVQYVFSRFVGQGLAKFLLQQFAFPQRGASSPQGGSKARRPHHNGDIHCVRHIAVLRLLNP